eukprot:scaffold34594_cov165-Amphora_coffeaeformis.AAC.6
MNYYGGALDGPVCLPCFSLNAGDSFARLSQRCASPRRRRRFLAGTATTAAVSFDPSFRPAVCRCLLCFGR